MVASRESALEGYQSFLLQDYLDYLRERGLAMNDPVAPDLERIAREYQATYHADRARAQGVESGQARTDYAARLPAHVRVADDRCGRDAACSMVTSPGSGSSR
jgi:hypothetical protein